MSYGEVPLECGPGLSYGQLDRNKNGSMIQVWGFDCNHLWDVSPVNFTLYLEQKMGTGKGTDNYHSRYWTYDQVRAEVLSLAAQLKAAEGEPAPSEVTASRMQTDIPAMVLLGAHSAVVILDGKDAPKIDLDDPFV